jgi:hypothetical protein
VTIPTLRYGLCALALIVACHGSQATGDVQDRPCSDAADCAGKAERIPGGFGSADVPGSSEVQPPAMIDSARVQQMYYRKACAFNPTGNSCVMVTVLENGIRNLQEAGGDVQRLKQLERP